MNNTGHVFVGLLECAFGSLDFKKPLKASMIYWIFKRFFKSKGPKGTSGKANLDPLRLPKALFRFCGKWEKHNTKPIFFPFSIFLIPLVPPIKKHKSSQISEKTKIKGKPNNQCSMKS